MSNRDSTVSIVIPAYNEERYLPECLQSLKEQTHTPVEVIVVDDGSTDKTKEVVRKFGYTLLSQDHKGPGVARNYGARHATSAIVAFLDADMYYDKYYIEHLIRPILENKAIGTFNKLKK
jgi:glycosyltransferase involved in cell wall biosynthesis